MPDHLLYLVIDAGVLIIPLIFSFHPRLRFHKYWLAFLPACILTAIPFLVWDEAFTVAGVWGFNPRYLTGISLLHLPLEEWLFFLCIPYACVFVHHVFGLVKWRPKVQFAYWLLGATGVALLVIAYIYQDRAYTFLTGLLTGIALLYLTWIRRPAWLPRATLAYIAILPFFFISNGLLTGSWIADEVVWYNNAENLGVRMGTIPVEDTFYGFLLILLNIFLFEQFSSRMRPAGGK